MVQIYIYICHFLVNYYWSPFPWGTYIYIYICYTYISSHVHYSKFKRKATVVLADIVVVVLTWSHGVVPAAVNSVPSTSDNAVTQRSSSSHGRSRSSRGRPQQQQPQRSPALLLLRAAAASPQSPHNLSTLLLPTIIQLGEPCWVEIKRPNNDCVVFEGRKGDPGCLFSQNI